MFSSLYIRSRPPGEGRELSKWKEVGGGAVLQLEAGLVKLRLRLFAYHTLGGSESNFPMKEDPGVMSPCLPWVECDTSRLL